MVESKIKLPSSIDVPSDFEGAMQVVRNMADKVLLVDLEEQTPILIIFSKERSYNLEVLCRKLDDELNKGTNRLDFVVLGEYDNVDVKLGTKVSKNGKKISRRIEL